MIQATAWGTPSRGFLMCDPGLGFPPPVTLEPSEFLFHRESALQRCSGCYRHDEKRPTLQVESVTSRLFVAQRSLTEVAGGADPASRTGTKSVDVITAPAVKTQTLLLAVQPVETLRTR